MRNKTFLVVGTCLLSISIMGLTVGSVYVYAQEKPAAPQPTRTTAPVLTADQKLAGRSIQVKLLQAQSQLEQTPQYQQVQQLKTQLQSWVSSVYSDHKVTPAEYTLCDDPSPGPCVSAPAGDLTMQPIKKEDKK